MVRKYIRRGKRGLEAEPDFTKEEIVFHPIPASLQGKVKEGEEWEGRLGVKRYTGKKDVYGTPIYVQFFIPTEKVYFYRRGGYDFINGKPYLLLRAFSGEREEGYVKVPPESIRIINMSGHVDVVACYDTSKYKGINLPESCEYFPFEECKDKIILDSRLRRELMQAMAEAKKTKEIERPAERESGLWLRRLLMSINDFCKGRVGRTINVEVYAIEVCFEQGDEGLWCTVEYYAYPKTAELLMKSERLKFAEDELLKGEYTTVQEMAEEGDRWARMVIAKVREALDKCATKIIINFKSVDRPPEGTVKIEKDLDKVMYFW